MHRNKRGTVYLIGAGPGDPELITLKAKRILLSADIVLYDYLAHPNIVMLAGNAKKICVGKKKGSHSTNQKDIHELLLIYSKKNRHIVRLKGGDPFVFARSGEEMAFLKKHNIHFEIVPGITSAVAVPAYAGIPITHRDHSHSVAFVTATRTNDIENCDIPIADTIVIMMGLLRVDALVKRLKELMDKTTKVAIIESGTLAAERVITGTLDTILDTQKKERLKPPALLIVGKVVNLAKEFNWRDYCPLKNQRFVLCRAMHQQSLFRDMLFSAGAEVLSIPLNDISTEVNALKSINFDLITHVLFTSENGVKSFVESLVHINLDSRVLANKIIVAIGNHTKDTLSSVGLIPDIVPSNKTSEGVIASLKESLNSGHHVLIPTSSEADDVLKKGCEHLGATVDQCVAYKNNVPKDMDMMISCVQPTDHLIFMNAASVHRFFSNLSICKEKNSNNFFNKESRIYSIGPKTSAAIKKYTSKPIIEAENPNLDALFGKIKSS